MQFMHKANSACSWSKTTFARNTRPKNSCITRNFVVNSCYLLHSSAKLVSSRFRQLILWHKSLRRSKIKINALAFYWITYVHHSNPLHNHFSCKWYVYIGILVSSHAPLTAEVVPFLARISIASKASLSLSFDSMFLSRANRSLWVTQWSTSWNNFHESILRFSLL